MKSTVESCVEVILHILDDIGVPVGATPLRRTRQAKALMALMGVRAINDLEEAKALDERGLTTREIIEYENRFLGEQIGSGSYDDIRRKDLQHSALASVAIQEDGRSKNDGTRKWGVSKLAVEVFRSWGTQNYENAVNTFILEQGRLSDELQRRRELMMVPVTIPGGGTYHLAGGEHDELIREIIENFLPRYGYGAELVYFADAENRSLHLNSGLIEELKIPSLEDGDLLPDVMSYSYQKNWLYLIEAVHSTGPISEEKRLLLSRRFKKCSADIIFVTAFANKSSWRTFAADIAWETEVWIADAPDHLIHYNGDKFLGPYD